jgi:SagB-type dehydrogenase family enzyme
MDMKTFEYLYYRTRGFDKQSIMKNADITDEEYDFLEGSLSGVVASIEAERPAAQNIGADFLRLTRYVYERQSDQENGIARPDAIKPRSGEIIALPAIGNMEAPEMSLREAISIRRSVRDYADQPLSQNELSWLLWSSCWARDFRTNERMEITLRNVPSAGARHPFECHLLVRCVDGIAPGLYYYHPIKHCLIATNLSESIATEVFDGCLRQGMVMNAAVTFILSAVPYRTIWRYGQRGYRYLYLDAGHVGQNIHLAAEAIGAGACMIGAFQDEAMNDCIAVDGVEEFVIYIATVGKKKN